MKERKQKLREGTVWLHPDFGESSYLRLCEYLYATGITKVDLANKLGIQYRQLYKLLELEVDAIDRELAERILKLHKGKFGETVPEVLRGIFATADKFRLGGLD